ncbi:MAG: hypothetical protein PHQ98_01755 [Candidatus ainarchaeum sp.]|nr:hypothetical protein [Candidatus ainarchaeum sp.]
MKLTMDDILLMNAFETISKVSSKDCIVKDNIVTFMVDGKLLGKAIGSNAINVKNLENKLKKKIELIGFYENPEKIIEQTFNVTLESKKNVKNNLILKLSNQDKKKIFNNFSRLKRIQELISRNYNMNLMIE